MNQLLGQLDRAFPGLTMALPDVLGTKIGRLVAAEFADPARLAALGVKQVDSVRRVAAMSSCAVRWPSVLWPRLKDALPTADAAVARRVLAADVALLADLNTQIGAVEAELAALIPRSPFSTLTSVPGWGMVRVANYAAALGDPDRWPGPRQIYRGIGTLTDAIRIGRQTPRRNDQPRGQRDATPSPD